MVQTLFRGRRLGRSALAAFCLALLVGLVAVGCGENTAQLSDVDPDGQNFQNPRDAEVSDPVSGACCILVPAGLTDYELNIGSNFDLGVLLYSRETGEPIADRLIAWTIEGSGEASLSAFETPTDADGLATVTLRAGQTLTRYTVTASHADVRPVEFTIDIVQLPSGDLLVNVINSGASQLEVKPFDVGIYYNADIDCRHFNPLSLPPSAIATGQAAMDGETLSFENLLSGYEYTILGVAYGPNGTVAAKACIDGERLYEEEVREVDLIFQLIPLNPVGTYRVRSYFDFGDAIAQSGSIGQYLVMIFDGFNNPGKLLYDVIFDLCAQVAPGLLCDALDSAAGWSGADEQLQAAINDLVLSSQTGCSIVRAGCDVRAAIRTMETLGTLYMSKLGADFRIYGSTTFTGLAYYWRFNCPAGSPDDCGRHELSYDEMLDLNIVSGDWEGTVTGYDHLIIGNHGVDLNYGELIVFIINNAILPQIAGGATNFTDALKYWFNCDGFADWLSNIEIFDQSLSWDTSHSVCSGAIGLLGNVLGFGSALLSLQEFSSVMSLNGEVTFVENDGDFGVDELVDGSWGGTLSFGSGTSPVRGAWSGCRIESETGTCEYPPVDFSIQGGDGACRCDAMCNCSE